MDKWIEENPRATMYILIVSALLIIVLTIFLYYYSHTSEYMKMCDRELLTDIRKKITKKPTKNVDTIADIHDDDDEDDGDFTIVDAD